MADIAAAAIRVAVGLPSAVERLLLDVVADGFVVCCCGGRVKPTALVAFYEWEHCIDLITIGGLTGSPQPGFRTRQNHARCKSPDTSNAR